MSLVGTFAHWYARLDQARATATVGPIGLEFAQERVHLVQMAFGPTGPKIHAAVSLPYPSTRQALLEDRRGLRALLAEARSVAPLRGRNVVACLPSDVPRLLLINYSVADGRSAEAAIAAELRVRLEGEIDGSVIDYLPIRASEEADGHVRSAVVAVAPRSKVIAFLDLLQGVGLEPLALDIGPAALCRLVTALRGGDEADDALLVTFGRDRSYLTVIWGQGLMLDRVIEFGENALIAHVAKTLEVDERTAATMLREYAGQMPSWLDAAGGQSLAGTLREVLRPAFSRLANEINRTLVYVASQTRGRSVARMYVVGSAARYPRILEWLQDVVALPMALLDPLVGFAAASPTALAGQPEATAGMAVAAGLALRRPERDRG